MPKHQVQQITLHGGVTGKPATYTPSAHTHDDRYYTKSEVDGGLNNRLALIGGTMSGSLAFSEIGDVGTSAGLHWSGQTDGASIYYQTTASDQGNLVLNMFDDDNTTIRFDWNGTNKAYISSDGVYHGTATYANSAGDASTIGGKTFNWSGKDGQPTWLWGGEDGRNMYVYNPSNFNVHMSEVVHGSYSGNGGQQGPSYFGRERAGFLMSNQVANNSINYKNWLYMDNFNGDDAGGATAIGLDRQEPRAYLLQSTAERTEWNSSTELLSLYNYTTYTIAKSGDTMKGALNFANGTRNIVGDDVAIGDFNGAGLLGVQGWNGTTGIGFIKYGDEWTSGNTGTMRYDGSTFALSAAISAPNFVGNINGLVDDVNTENTSNTWVPVFARGGVVQHREIPTAYNNDPSTLSVNHANSAQTIDGLTHGLSDTWGNQTGTNIVNFDTGGGGGIQIRDNNPSSGKCSMLIDGTVYVNEGLYPVISTENIGSQSVNYATTAGTANNVAWANISGKPSITYYADESNLPSEYTGANVWKSPS